MILTFFWKYIKFSVNSYIIWPYLENLIFHPTGSHWVLFCPEGGFCWFRAYGSYIFLKIHKIFSQFKYNMAIFGKILFFTLWRAPGCYFALRGFSVNFEHMVLIFFWKYIKFAIDWYIIWPYLLALIFYPMGSPQGKFFAPADLCTALL